MITCGLLAGCGGPARDASPPPPATAPATTPTPAPAPAAVPETPAAVTGPRLVSQDNRLFAVGGPAEMRRGALLFVLAANPLPQSEDRQHIGIVEGVERHGGALRVTWHCAPDAPPTLPESGLPLEPVTDSTVARFGSCLGRFRPDGESFDREIVRLRLDLGARDGVHADDEYNVLGAPTLEPNTHFVNGFERLGRCRLAPGGITDAESLCRLDRSVWTEFGRDDWLRGGFVRFASDDDEPPSPPCEVFPQACPADGVAGRAFDYVSERPKAVFSASPDRRCGRRDDRGWRLTYDVSTEGAFGGWGITWDSEARGGFDAAAYAGVELWIKRIGGDETFQIAVKQAVKPGVQAPEPRVESKMLVEPGPGWKRAYLRFDALPPPSLERPYRLDNVTIGVDSSHGRGELCVDDIRLVPSPKAVGKP